VNGLDPVYRYHDGTKHHFNRLAGSLGYLDWASQPCPFRSYAGAREIPLPPRPDAAGPAIESQSVQCAIGSVLRHSLGLSAWKRFRALRSSIAAGRGEPVESRWSLRVNPSSGNLHPTEAYIVAGPADGASATPAVYHYAADRHALEERCAFEPSAWPGPADQNHGSWLVALTSIHWREAWKYGERAFRYCQHDLGHAIAAVRIAAALYGCRARMLPDWSHADIAALTGIDRDEDFIEAEREEPGCVMVIGRALGVGSRASVVGSPESLVAGHEALLAAVREGQWTGRASQLSEDHVRWSFIDEIAEATRDPGRDRLKTVPCESVVREALEGGPGVPTVHPIDRGLVLQRRSAVALDGQSSVGADRFFGILQGVMPHDAAPWDVLWWDARIHLALFVHRVHEVDPGVYLLVRDPSAVGRLRAACRREFLWQPIGDTLPLFLLARGDCRRLAQRVSCDQEIAADGFFSLGMVADFDTSLEAFGPSFYRHLFWESGVVGQVLYLEAEAAGTRGTGIGCFYDDPVHDVLGLTGHAFQSLYHFTIGIPVEDTRLTTQPGYAWEI
jgi:nitroreductase